MSDSAAQRHHDLFSASLTDVYESVFSNQQAGVPGPHLFRLSTMADSRGDLTVVEGTRDLGFPIERVYYLHNLPDGSARGGHAHKQLRQLMIALSGTFDVHLDNGQEKRTVHLSDAGVGLVITTMIWREIDNFSPGAVCLVLASMPYDESDYYRDYAEFKGACNRACQQAAEKLKNPAKSLRATRSNPDSQ